MPLTVDTKNLISRSLLNTMKSNSILINTARGGIVNENDLYHCLKNNKIRSAAFDVLNNEPPLKNKLIGLENFFITPHIGSTTQSVNKMGLAAIEGLLKINEVFSMKKIKCGIVGFGKIAKIRAKVIEEIDNTILTAIHDTSEIYLENNSIKFFDNYSDLLNQELDAVIISTYAKSLAEYAIKALEAGKHVFCEKLPALNSKEMLAVIKAERQSGKVLKYGFNHRYHYSVIEAKKIIESGDLGKILLMRGVYGKAGSIDFDKN